MTTNSPAPIPNPVQHGDASVLIGILAILEGEIWAGQLDEWTTGKVAERYTAATVTDRVPTRNCAGLALRTFRVFASG